MGSIEQHGPHLPLNTDTRHCRSTDARASSSAGARATISGNCRPCRSASRASTPGRPARCRFGSGMTALRARPRTRDRPLLPARNLLIVNGHGGNRGILEALGRELRTRLRPQCLHAASRRADEPGDGRRGAGNPRRQDETSVMLALAPDLVRQEAIASAEGPPGGDAVARHDPRSGRELAWSSDDTRLAEPGVMGDARGASAEHGRRHRRARGRGRGRACFKRFARPDLAVSLGGFSISSGVRLAAAALDRGRRLVLRDQMRWRDRGSAWPASPRPRPAPSSLRTISTLRSMSSRDQPRECAM